MFQKRSVKVIIYDIVVGIDSFIVLRLNVLVSEAIIVSPLFFTEVYLSSSWQMPTARYNVSIAVPANPVLTIVYNPERRLI